MAPSTRQHRTWLLGCVSAAALLMMPVGQADANPKGGSVSAGSATISTSGQTLTVTQHSNRAVVNWQGFSIGAGETTRFVQPSSAAAILNRVTGGDPSLLHGQLKGNGRVYLINPNGIVVGPNGRIDTGSFVASTHDLSDAAFMQGGPLIFKGESGAGIKVLGSVEAATGDTVLVAVAVDNQGSVTAPNGQAILAAGGEMLYVPDGQSDIVVKAPGAAASPGEPAVSNAGTIEAASVQLKAAGSPYALAVNQAGQINATSVRAVGGRVVLDGGDGDTVIEGTVTARAGDHGGAVTATGKRVTLTEYAAIDVSAPSGGGTVAIGGGAYGADPAIANAETTSVAAGARIDAGATERGTGGSVVVWSDGRTDYAGSIRSRGGPAGGDGGNVEISGKDLRFAGTVDLTAPNGTTGHLLLDPETFDVDAGTAAALVAALETANSTVAADTSIAVNAAVASSSANTLTFDAPTIGLNAEVWLSNGTLRFISSGATGERLQSAEGTTMTAALVDVAGNYHTVTLEGAVVTDLLAIRQPGATMDSLTAASGANRIATLLIPGGITMDGDTDIYSQSAMEVFGQITADGEITLVSEGNLILLPGTKLTSEGITTLASIDGVVMNQAGPGLLAGGALKRIYTSTDANGFSDGGLNYPQIFGVFYDADQDPRDKVTYIRTASGLPTLTITAADIARRYGAAIPALSATFGGGTSGDLATPVQFQVLDAGRGDVGAYTILPYGAVSTTHVLKYVDGTLTIVPAPLTIVAENATRLAGTPNPPFSARYVGLVNGDTPAVVSGLSFFTPTFPSFLDISGVFPIVPHGATAPNYAISFVPGQLVVTPPPPPPTPTVVHTATFEPGKIGEPVTTTDPFGIEIVILDLGEGPTEQTIELGEIDLDFGPIKLEEKAIIWGCGGCTGLHGGAFDEFRNVIEQFVAAAGGSTTPPLTVDSVRAALNDPEKSATMMGALLPFLYADLTSILDIPESEWTSQQTGFVQSMQTYIQTQRQAAAQQAVADYQAWAELEKAKLKKSLEGMPPSTQVQYLALMSTNPPVPPAEILATAQLGFALDAEELGAYIAMTSQTAKSFAALEGGGEGGLSNEFIPGVVADVAKIATTASLVAGASDSLDLVAIVPKLGTVFSKTVAAAARIAKKAADGVKIAQAVLDAAQAAGDAAKIADAAADLAQAQKVLSSVTKGLSSAKAATSVIPVVGLVVELAANVIQATIAIVQYAQIGDFNNALAQAVGNAQKPVTVADLKQMAGTEAGQTQMFTYLAAMAATNGGAPGVSQPTMTLGEVITYAGQY